MSSVVGSSDSSFRLRVLMDEVTSHEIVVKSLRMRDTVQVGASGFLRPESREKLLSAIESKKN